MSKLNDMIRGFREEIGQSIEAIALLMQMQPEEYAKLEEDWIPPDDTLQKLCTLFEWNYQEIKQIVAQTPASNPVNKPISPELREESGTAEIQEKPTNLSFGDMLREARENVGQGPEGVSTLLNIPADYYLQFENGATPPDEILRKLCSLFSWNYLQVRQKIITHSSKVLGAKQPPLTAREIKSKFPKVETKEFQEVQTQLPLHQRIQEARMEVKQNIEGISLLLQINPEYYQQIENGQTFPDQELLKKISSLFGWNYHELLSSEQKSKLRQLQPAITTLDSTASSVTEHKLWNIQEEIAKNWKKISREQQESLITQLELIRETMSRWLK